MKLKLFYRSRLVLVFALIGFGIPFAASADLGESGWPVFEKIQSARFGGISANATLGDNFAGFLYNPALLSTNQSRTLFFHSELGFFEDLLTGAFYTEPGRDLALGFGLVYYDMGRIELNWVENNQVVTESASAGRDILGMASVGYRFHDAFRAGITLKAGRSELVERHTAMAVAADIGLLAMPDPAWAVSLAVRNLGYATPYTDAAVALPTTLYLGTGYTFQTQKFHLLPVVGCAYNMVDGVLLPEAGLEAGYDILSLTAGYRFNLEEANLHLGVGIQWQGITFNYAFIPGNYLDASHRITLGMGFGSVSQPEAKTGAQSKPDPVSEKAVAKSSQNASASKPEKTAAPKSNTKKTASQTTIPKASMIKIKRMKNRLAISWKKPKSATTYQYNVYLKTGNGQYACLNEKPIKTTSFYTKSLKPGKTYSIIVKTVDASGRESSAHQPTQYRLK